MDCPLDEQCRSSALAGFLLLALAACAPKASDSQTGTGTQSASTDGTGTQGTGAGSQPCVDRMTEESCLHVEETGSDAPPEGEGCGWIQVYTLPSDPGDCDLGAAVGRCIDVEYIGDGCMGSDCAVYPRVYYRQIPGDTFEIFASDLMCGSEPIDWVQCFAYPDTTPLVCDCLCD